MERIKVEEAAKMLGISKQAVRVLMERNILEIGMVVDGKRKRYLIFKEKLAQAVGKKEGWQQAYEART